MKKLLIMFLATTFSLSCYADFNEYKISVDAENDFEASIGMTYSATKKTFFCTELDISDGSFKRVAKWKTVIYPQTNEGIIVAPKSLEGKCHYKQRTEAYIRVTIPGRADAYNTVYITDGELSLGVQTIRCKEIQINNGNSITCSGSLQADQNGNLSVKIVQE